MRLFVIFLLLCFLAGMVGRPTLSDFRGRWFVAVVAVGLVVGYYFFHRI